MVEEKSVKSVLSRINYALLAITAMCLDLFTKFIVKINLDANESVPVMDGLFRITLTFNKSSLYGVLNQLQHQWVYFAAAGIVAFFAGIIVLLYVLVSRFNAGRFTVGIGRIGLMLAIGGLLGNSLDWLMHKSVVEFFDFGYGSHRFVVFNIADLCLFAAVILLSVTFIKQKMKKIK